MKALLLCAGLGERLRPHTQNRAKPSLPFLNIPMLAYAWRVAKELGASELVINTHHAAKSVEQAASSLKSINCPLHFSHEPEAGLGGGGALNLARQWLERDEEIILANGDAIYLPGALTRIKEFYRDHQSSGALATLLVCPFPGVGQSLPGVWLNADHSVSGFGKSSKQTSDRAFHFTGFILLRPDVYRWIPQSGPSNILYDVLVKALQEAQLVRAYVDPDARWFETGNPTDYLQATRQCLELLTQAGAPADYLRTCLSEQFPEWRDGLKARNQLLGPKVSLDPTSRLKGFTVIGEACEIGAGAVIENSVLGAGVKVPAGTSLRDQLLF